MNKKIGVEVVIVKKRSRKFLVRHPDGELVWVEDVSPEEYKRKNVGDTLTALIYDNEEEADEAVARMKRGEFPDIERPSQN